MRIAIFLDGTWSDQDRGTNIAQIASRAENIPGGQIARYVEGVGTGPWQRLRGGVFARGLDEKIVEGYRIIAEQYQDGDEIFLFGYSRGAFTARSLAGMIAKCGIVPPDVLPADRVFARYRDTRAPGLRELQTRELLPRTGGGRVEDELVLRRSTLVRIRFIGVFDTVGSLGIPGTIGKLFAGRYAFHDTRLSGLVDHARHAIALDERRASFEPTLWTSVPIPVPGPGRSTTVEQRWFVGSHGNVGGGEPPPGRENLLSTITREWIVGEARAAGLAITPDPPPAAAHLGMIAPSHRGFPFGLLNAVVPSQKDLPRKVRMTSLNETLDDSVLRRWEADVAYRDRDRPPDPGLWAWVQAKRAELRAGEGVAAPDRAGTNAMEAAGKP